MYSHGRIGQVSYTVEHPDSIELDYNNNYFKSQGIAKFESSSLRLYKK